METCSSSFAAAATEVSSLACICLSSSFNSATSDSSNAMRASANCKPSACDSADEGVVKFAYLPSSDSSSSQDADCFSDFCLLADFLEEVPDEAVGLGRPDFLLLRLAVSSPSVSTRVVISAAVCK